MTQLNGQGLPETPLEALDLIYKPEFLERYGPLPLFWQTQSLPVSPPSATDLLRNTRPLVELKHSGYRTAMIIYHEMAEKILPSLDGVSVQTLWRVVEFLDKLKTTIKTYLRDEEMVDFEEEFDQLLGGDVTPTERGLLRLDVPPEASDKDWPFVSYVRFDNAEEVAVDMEQQTAYWLKRDLTSYIVHPSAESETAVVPPASLWDVERLRLTVTNGFVMFWAGRPLPAKWLSGLSGVAAGLDHDSKPVFVVLITQFAAVTGGVFQDHGDFYLLYLPAPRFPLYGDDPQLGPLEHHSLPPSFQRFLPENTAILPLERIAESWDTEVIYWADDAEPPPFTPVFQLLEWATVDRQGVRLGRPPFLAGEFPTLPNTWGTQKLYVFTLPQNRDLTPLNLTEFEKLVRLRAELNDGFVSGATAGFYRTGLMFEETVSESIDDRQQLIETIQASVGRALQVPAEVLLRFIDNREFALEWLLGGPLQTFKLTEAENELLQTNEFIEENGVFLVRGDARDLGLVTPLPETSRIVDEAFELLFVELIQRVVELNREGE